MLSHFFLTTGDSHGTAHLALSFVDMYSAAVSMWIVTKSLYLSFEVYVSDISRRELDLLLTGTAYLLLISLLVLFTQPLRSGRI